MKKKKRNKSNGAVQVGRYNFFSSGCEMTFASTTNKFTVRREFSADGATLKLDNQQNGWKGVCV